jgi:hypothetical protein
MSRTIKKIIIFPLSIRVYNKRLPKTAKTNFGIFTIGLPCYFGIYKEM